MGGDKIGAQNPDNELTYKDAAIIRASQSASIKMILTKDVDDEISDANKNL